MKALRDAVQNGVEPATIQLIGSSGKAKHETIQLISSSGKAKHELHMIFFSHQQVFFLSARDKHIIHLIFNVSDKNTFEEIARAFGSPSTTGGCEFQFRTFKRNAALLRENMDAGIDTKDVTVGREH